MKVELRDIHKHFGKVHANAGINLEIPSGTIQGILGENGAGKSTLMKILSGFIRADSGEILLDGKPVIISSPADAIRHGIGMLHQDPLDFPPMRVIDNFVLGHPGGLFPDRSSVAAEFHELAERLEFAIDPDAYVETLTVGERQQLEIMRLLWLGARVLILDEPTTGISASQKEKLFLALLNKLAVQGVTILYVSHKLEDVEILSDSIAVFRQGKLIGETKRPFDTDRLVEMMFGKNISPGARQSMIQEDCILSLSKMSVEGGRLLISDVNFQVRAGEVIGLAGMEGSGQGLFLRSCAGLVRPVAGHVEVIGQNLTGKSYHIYKKNGVEFLPAARLEEGLVAGLTLTDHFVLAEEPKGVFIDRESGLKLSQERIASFNIKGRPESTIESLSGGNQQRALLSLLRSPLSLVLIEHPTRGLDIESVIYIWGKLKERCKQGAAILFISSDLEEILQYSDRVLVFFSGKVSRPLDAASTSVEQLGQLIGGKGWDEISASRVSHDEK
ncbi:MAG TPA: ATP-binding cassette domain-containing protein [Anaerolineales bacterium]|nr:ATP-binding cassette domain-containing protein [Anaerolineales bacterium]